MKHTYRLEHFSSMRLVFPSVSYGDVLFRHHNLIWNQNSVLAGKFAFFVTTDKIITNVFNIVVMIVPAD